MKTPPAACGVFPLLAILLFLCGAQVHSENTPKNPADDIESYRKAAESGDAADQYTLGLCYAFGLGVPKDSAEAVKWCRKAADQGDAKAQAILGLFYAEGEGVPKNDAEAVKWYRKAAEQGDAKAQVALGLCYADGKGVIKDEVEAYKWWLLAAGQGIKEAREATATLENRLTREKIAEGQKLSRNFKPHKAPDAGAPVPANEGKAAEIESYRKAAEQGAAEAQCLLGSCYDKGDGVPKDDGEAYKWFRKAAVQGLGAAQYMLGTYYASGKGVPKDIGEAVKWYRKAAEQGFADAQYMLGCRYAIGYGVPKDTTKAAEWQRKAAEQGLASAQDQLGLYYTNGKGVAKNDADAAKWYRKAALQGFAGGQLNLGVCYYRGTGVVKDQVEAYKWWLLAAGQGDAGAKKNMALLEKQLTRNEIAEGQKLARNFKPRKAPAAGVPIPSNDGDDSIPRVTGTGFFITDGGFLITNKHVIEGANQVRLATSAGLIAAKVVKVDAANDLALLKAEGKFAALPVTTSRGVKLGASVATVGFPNIGMQGFAPKLAKGEIAGLSGAADDARYFQISVPVQPGNSGGALVDERGNVVGVVSAKLDAATALAASGALPENVNYAVKSSFLLGFLESVPAVVSELKEPNTQEEKFENVVQSVERAAALVLNTGNKPTAENPPPQAPTEAPSTVPDAPPAPPQPQVERKEHDPAAALPEIPEKLAAALIGAFLRHGEGNDMQLELADYADVVNPYFDQGRMTRQGIAKDIAAYRAQWRDRSFQLLQVESATKNDANTLEAIYRLQFRASDGKKSRAGVHRQSIHYTRAGDRWLVSGIQTIERVSK